MTTERFEDILDESLRMMEAGVTLEDCAARHPLYAEELRAQLAMAQTLRASRMPAQPELAAVARGRALLLSTAAQQRDARNGHAPGMPFPLLGAAARRLLIVPYALPSVLALVLLGGAALGVSAATGNADPRDWFSQASQSRIELRGVLSAIDATSLTVETSEGPVQAAITPDTEFEDEQDDPTTPAAFAVGDVVKVHAVRAEDGSLVARKVEIEGLEDDDADDNSGPGSLDDDTDGDDDNGGPGNADDDGADDDNSGPGSADDDGVNDNSGPGSLDDDADDSSGPGSGSDDADSGDHDGDEGGGSGSADDGDEDGDEGDDD